MATTELPQRTQFPKTSLTDAEAGARDFPSSNSRTYTYFKPAKRARRYEDVTVDVQPGPGAPPAQGWIYGFGDGTGGYPQEWTALKSSNWHAFLDPNEEWNQTIFRNNATSCGRSSQCRQREDGPRVRRLEHRLARRSNVTSAPGCMSKTGWHARLPRNGPPTNMINTALR